MIAEDRPFEGEIHDAGDALAFERDGEVLAEVPKSLVNQIRGLLREKGPDSGAPKVTTRGDTKEANKEIDTQ